MFESSSESPVTEVEASTWDDLEAGLEIFGTVALTTGVIIATILLLRVMLDVSPQAIAEWRRQQDERPKRLKSAIVRGGQIIFRTGK